MFTSLKKIYIKIQDIRAQKNERELLETMYKNDTISLKSILAHESSCVMKMVRGAQKTKPLPLYVFMAAGRANGQISYATEIILNDALLCHLANISNNFEEAMLIFEQQISQSTENSAEFIEVFVQPWKKYFIESKTNILLNDVRLLSTAIHERLPMAIENEKLKRTVTAAGYAAFL